MSILWLSYINNKQKYWKYNHTCLNCTGTKPPIVKMFLSVCVCENKATSFMLVLLVLIYLKIRVHTSSRCRCLTPAVQHGDWLLHAAAQWVKRALLSAEGELCRPPCENGGRCLANEKGDWRCYCWPDFSGERCEVNHCTDYCLNGGTCMGSPLGKSPFTAKHHNAAESFVFRSEMKRNCLKDSASSLTPSSVSHFSFFNI